MFKALLNTTFDHYRRVRTPDNVGGFEITYKLMGQVSGRLNPRAGREHYVGEAPVREITHIIYTEADQDIARNDILEVDIECYEVLGVRNPSRLDHHLEVDCREYQREINTDG